MKNLAAFLIDLRIPDPGRSMGGGNSPIAKSINRDFLLEVIPTAKCPRFVISGITRQTIVINKVGASILMRRDDLLINLTVLGEAVSDSIDFQK